MSRREGYRGYIFSRPFMGERVPQKVQNLVIRDYASRNQLDCKLSATEYAMEGCSMMLIQVLSELKTLEGMICYSLFQLPATQEMRYSVYNRVLSIKARMCFALEDIVICSLEDVKKVEEIWQVREILSKCPTIREIAKAC